MANNLTGQKVSFTFKHLVQERDGSFYNGLGLPIDIVDVSSLKNYLIPFVPDSSLNPSQFFWENGYLDVSVIGGSGVSKFYVDGSLLSRDASIEWLYDNRLDSSIDYTTYEPRIGDVSLYYDLSGNVVDILTVNDIGTKSVNFIYDLNGDVAIININNYGVDSKEITFEKDLEDNIIAVHIR